MKRLLVISSILFFIISCENKNGNTMTANENKTDSSKAEKMESKEERNKKIAKEVMEALNNHDVDKMVSLMSNDAVEYGDGSGKAIKGADSIKANMKSMMNAFPDFKASELRYFADGDQVVVLGEYSGTFKMDMGKYKATNKSFKFPDADIFTLNDEGKITAHRYIQPDATMFSQIAVKPK